MADCSGSLPRPHHAPPAALADLPAAGAGGPAAARRETARDARGGGPRPPTPAPRKRGGQHYARQPPGAIVRHFGSARDPPHEGPFGCKTRAGLEAAADCLKSLPGSEIARWRQEREEDVYIRWERSLA